MSSLPFVVMAKPVGSRCNLRCRYCYYLDKGKFSSHQKQSRMSFDLLEKLIRQTIQASSGPIVSFTWHGGEPTLAGLDFYQKAIELEKKYLPKNWQVWNNLQTNGILLNDHWVHFLKENRFDVGLSLDGNQWVHDANRLDLRQSGSYQRVLAAAKRLKAAGIEPDLLCTVNAATIKQPLEVYQALRELDTGWIQFIPIVIRLKNGQMAPESIDASQYGTFLCTVFDEWVHHDLGRLDVQLFAETARVLAHGKASLCWMSETCGRVLIVEEDGAVYSCDHFVDENHRIGNLFQNSLADLANSAAQLAFGNQKKQALSAECRACPYLAYCHGGCLKDRFAQSSTKEKNHYYLCGGLKQFFGHALPILKQIMQLSQAGKTPQAIMECLNTQKR